MEKMKIDRWIVLKGRPTFTCKTRKQARALANKNRAHYPEFNYIGKCIDGHRKIILDA